MSNVNVHYGRANSIVGDELALLKTFEEIVKDQIPKLFGTMSAWWERANTNDSQRFQLVSYTTVGSRKILAEFSLKELEAIKPNPDALNDRLVASSHHTYSDSVCLVKLEKIHEDEGTLYCDLRQLNGPSIILNNSARLDGRALRESPQDHAILAQGPDRYRVVLRNFADRKFFDEGDTYYLTFKP